MGVKLTGCPVLWIVFVATLVVTVMVDSEFGTTEASAEVSHRLLFSFDGHETPAGSFEGLGSVAIEQSSGDVWVTAGAGGAVSKFDSSGKYLGVSVTGASVPQGSLGVEKLSGVAVDNSGGVNNGDLYVASTTETGAVYRFDSSGKLLAEISGAETSAGSFFYPRGIAVDSGGNLYVADWGHHIIDEFSPSGAYVPSSARHVEGPFGEGPSAIALDTAGDVYVSLFGGKTVKLEPGLGELVLDGDSTEAVAVDPMGGHVLVGENAFPAPGLVVEYEASGARLGQFGGAEAPASEQIATGGPPGIAVSATSGDVFVTDTNAAPPRVDVFGPGFTIPDAKSGPASNITEEGATLSGTANPDGLPLTRCEFEYGNTPSYGRRVPCAQSPAEIGSGFSPVAVSANLTGLSRQTTYHYRLLLENENGPNHGADQSFTTTGPPRVDAESVSEVTRTEATLEAQIDPFGFDTRYQFEYGPTTSYGTNVPASAEDIGADMVDIAVSQRLTSLTSGATYHFRVVAVSECKAGVECKVPGEDQTFTTIPPVKIDVEFAADVTATSATLNAHVNPLGIESEYRLQYGPTTAYGTEFTGATGALSVEVPISVHVQKLQPAMTYHYRIVVTNTFGTIEGVDHTFTTRLIGNSELTLPDRRAWELVSPADKSGALIGVLTNPPMNPQAAVDGSAIAYQTNEAIGEEVSSRPQYTQIISTHGRYRWSSLDISPQYTLPTIGERRKANVAPELFYLFSPDLSQVAFEPQGPFEPLLEGITERTDLLRNNVTGTYLPLVTPINVPPGTKITGEGTEAWEQMNIEAITPDLRRVFLQSKIALTSDAGPTALATSNLYEWSNGQLKFLGEGKIGNSGSSFVAGMTQHAISDDGRWAMIAQEAPYPGPGKYFVRDTIEGKSIPFGGRYPYFQTMSTDGSKLFFLETEAGEFQAKEQGELYVFDPTTGIERDLSANHLEGESNADVQNTVIASEDGNYVYFVATGVLAPGAKRGADNFYVLHYKDNQWTTTYIATLSAVDRPDWQPGPHHATYHQFELRQLSTRVSPDGRYAAFMSSSSLTGYDNHDALSDQPDEEVYLYDAAANHLVCASCNPTGARPVGVLERGGIAGLTSGVLIDGLRTWEEEPIEIGEGVGVDPWLAGMLPATWNHERTAGSYQFGTYQPRDLFDNGRLFFNSTDALVPQDANGVADVYEYEPAGVGDCVRQSATYDERSGGCVNLISSGESPLESAFADASENGDDVFFVTASKLVPEDYDTSYDIYDAHVCGSKWSCQAASVLPPPCTSGDSCKAAPSRQPAIFGASPSATFAGQGNVSSSPVAAKAEGLSNKQKLVRALRMCRKKRARKIRAACERQARRRYSAKSKHASASRRGGK